MSVKSVECCVLSLKKLKKLLMTVSPPGEQQKSCVDPEQFSKPTRFNLARAYSNEIKVG